MRENSEKQPTLDRVEPTFKAGEHVEVFDGGKWRPAVLITHKPYHHGNCHGWDYRWLDVETPKESWMPAPSRGGWAPEHHMRERQ